METPAPRQIDNWQDAEHNAADWMRYWGYAEARAVPGGPDGGIDVRASGAIGQVKFQGTPVGRPMLQRLVGASSNATDQLFFFTGSNYSKAAVEYADERGIALFQYGPWGRMKPMNPIAVAMQQQAENQTSKLRARSVPAPDSLLHVQQQREHIRPERDWTPVKQHFKRNWAAWLGGYLVCLPVVMIGDQDFYGHSPLWQDVLKWIASWLMAMLFLAVHAARRHSRKQSPQRDKPSASGKQQHPGSTERSAEGPDR